MAKGGAIAGIIAAVVIAGIVAYMLFVHREIHVTNMGCDPMHLPQTNIPGVGLPDNRVIDRGQTVTITVPAVPFSIQDRGADVVLQVMGAQVYSIEKPPGVKSVEHTGNSLIIKC